MPKKQLKLILYLNLAHYSSADNLLPPVNKKMTFSSFPYNLMHQDSFAQEDLPDNHFLGASLRKIYLITGGVEITRVREGSVTVIPCENQLGFEVCSG